ncbi:hypothetical protein AB5I41_18950 [Sphingomonas sp. MMS24-JH45]
MLVGPVTAALKARSIDVPGAAPVLWIFALANLALLIAVQRVAGGITLPRRRAAPVVVPHETHRAPAAAPAIATAPAIHLPPPMPVAPSRALAVARAAEARVLANRGPAGSAGRAGSSAATSTLVSPARAPLLAHGTERAANRRTFSGKRLELGS